MKMPAYVDEMAKGAVARLKNLQYSDTVSFAFMTDTHNCNDYVERALYAIDEINKEVPISFTCMGGDYLCNNLRTTKDEAIAQHKEFADIVKKHNKKVPIVVAVGNHDFNVFGNDENAVYPYEIHDIIMAHHKNMCVEDTSAPKTLYGYYDDEKSKVRMIYLNLMDAPNADAEVNHAVALIGTKQLKWVADVALDLPDKEWGVVFFSHYSPIPHPFRGPDRVFGGEALWEVICAFKNGTAYSAKAKKGEYEYEVSCDFTNRGKGDVFGYFYGHHHIDRVWQQNGIPLIALLAGASDNFTGLSDKDEDGMWFKTCGSGEESAFSVFTINREERTIYNIRCGAGFDYSVTY